MADERRSSPDRQGTEPLNQVRLRGRVSSEPLAQELPSGTQVVSVRVVVPRGSTAGTRGSTVTSDWIRCSAWTAATRRSLGGWSSGDVVEIDGALRRRQYRTPGDGTNSVVEVEVLRARRVSRAAT